MATKWDILPGTTLPRRELHARHGGSWYGGMEPAVKSQSMFLFSKPTAGKAFGYVFDGWHDDGTFHYTGDGQVGDQSPDEGGNRALLSAARQGRTIRLFRSEGVNTTYLGVFALAAPAYYRDDALDRNREIRSVLIFRLRPVGDVVRQVEDVAGRTARESQEVSLESFNTETYVLEHPEEPAAAIRREAALVAHYAGWLSARGQKPSRHRIPIPGGGYLYTDLFNVTKQELIEAKASAARVYIRAGLGQILDYSRYIAHRYRALLLPDEPPSDLAALLHNHGVGVVWRSGEGYERSDPSQ